MTDHAALLRQIRADARPYIEQWLEIGEVFAGFRKLAAENDLDWGVIKALIKAEVQDEQEGGSKKVERIIEKADCASAYADMLGLGSGEEKNNFSADLPPHDEDGVIIDIGIAQGDGVAPAPGAGSAPITATGDAGEKSSASADAALDASPINSNTPGQSGTAREAPSQSRDTVRCPSHEEGEGASALSPINSGAPLTPDAPGECSPSRDCTPGAPITTETVAELQAHADAILSRADDWAELDIPAFLDRRRISEAAT